MQRIVLLALTMTAPIFALHAEPDAPFESPDTARQSSVYNDRTQIYSESVPQTLDEMVITANRTPNELRNVGSAITVITAEDIVNQQAIAVSDVLANVPGIDVVRTGGLGQTTTVFIRGASSDQTLVLIDGMEANDPSGVGNGFDFSNLMVDNIERIEVLRGPQSPLYGTNAIGGVINIITKTGQGEPGGFLQGQGGSFGTFKVGGGFSGSRGIVDFNISASHLEQQGFSAADENLPGNSEDDGYRNTTVSANLGVKPLENLDFKGQIRFVEDSPELDNCGGPNCDNFFLNAKNRHLVAGLKGHLVLFDGLWDQKVSLGYNHDNRIFRDATVGSFFPFSEFQGNRFKVDWQNNFYLHETNTLTFGIEHEEDWITTDTITQQSQTTTGYYLQDQIRLWDRSITTAGIRLDDNNRFGEQITWRVTQLINIDEIGMRLKGSYGTGFKGPTLFQLFGPPFLGNPVGNPALKPERSRGWDAGIEQTFWDQRVLVGVSYFYNSFDNLINFVTGSGFQNVDSAKTEGVESFVEFQPIDDLTLKGSYTYMRSRDDTTMDRLLRRPTHKGSINANYRFLDGADVNLNVLLVGDRDFLDFNTFPAVRQEVAGYVVVNLAAGYQINRYVKVFARVDNLFDQEYQNVLGYGTSRIAGYGGVRLSF